MNNLDIFVCSHYSSDIPVTDESYKLLSVGNNTVLYGDNIIRDDSGDNISNMNGFYCELTGHYWVWKNYDLKDWVGFCHYRRLFSFLDNIPNFSDEDYDIIVPAPLIFDQCVFDQYALCHNGEDLDYVKWVMVYKYGIPEELINRVFYEQTYAHCCNMFITKKEIFNEYCSFLFDILNQYLLDHNMKDIYDVYQHIFDNNELYLKHCYPNNHYKFQSKIGGALGERIFNVWIKWKNLHVKVEDWFIIGSKYEEQKDTDFL